MPTEVRTAINVEAKKFYVICVCNDPTIYAYVSVLAFKINISIIKDHRLEFVRICGEKVIAIPRRGKLIFLLKGFPFSCKISS